MSRPVELGYFGIELPGRSSVREPVPPPVLRLVARGGRIVTVTLDEAQLLSVAQDAIQTLNAMRKCRHATVPEETP